MSFQNVLDSLPIGGVFVTYAVVAAIVSEIGYRLGRWWQNRTPEEREGPTAMIVVLGAVITTVVDLDRPRDGFLQVNQQPLIDLQTQIGAFPSASPPP